MANTPSLNASSAWSDRHTTETAGHRADHPWGQTGAPSGFRAHSQRTIYTTVALPPDGRLYSNIAAGFTPAFYWLGLLSLAAGAFFALEVVRPRLRAFGLHKASSENYTYFGDSQYRESDDLATAPRRATSSR